MVLDRLEHYVNEWNTTMEHYDDLLEHYVEHYEENVLSACARPHRLSSM